MSPDYVWSSNDSLVRLLVASTSYKCFWIWSWDFSGALEDLLCKGPGNAKNLLFFLLRLFRFEISVRDGGGEGEQEDVGYYSNEQESSLEHHQPRKQQQLVEWEWACQKHIQYQWIPTSAGEWRTSPRAYTQKRKAGNINESFHIW